MTITRRRNLGCRHAVRLHSRVPAPVRDNGSVLRLKRPLPARRPR